MELELSWHARTPPNRPQKEDPIHPVAWVERPGLLVGGEVATLLDRGYQKFWKTARVEVPATADSLKAVHRFAEELREVIGEPSLYNESLGTTSDVYLYDRVQARDLPPAERPKRAWDLASGETPLRPHSGKDVGRQASRLFFRPLPFPVGSAL